MNVQNCPLCGRLFQQRGVVKVCPNCAGELEKDRQTAQGYLDAHPGAGIGEVSRETGVEIKRLRMLQRQSRITFSEQ